jgi:hypothetical protein
LSKPFYIPGSVVVSVKARSALLIGTLMPADGQAFPHHTPTARTSLAGECRIDRDHFPTGACCLEGKDAQERTPPRILNRLGEMVVPDHVGRLQILMVNRVVFAQQRERCLEVKVLSLATYLLMRFGKQDNRFLAAVAALLAPGYPTLRAFQRALGFTIPAGEKMRVPFDRVANASIPRSMPVSCLVPGKGCIGASTQEMQTYQPSASQVIVTVLGIPSMGRLQRMAIRPILDSTRNPLSSVAPLPNSL